MIRRPRLTAAVAAVALSGCAATPGDGVAASVETPQANGAAGGHEKETFLATYDGNRDGRVLRAEFDAERMKGFTARDANRDGVLIKQEYVAEYEARLDADLAALRASRTPPSEAELAAERAAQLAQAGGRFDTLDDDQDGKMSPAEFNDSGAWVFGQLDSNSDGVVDGKDTTSAY